MRQPRESSSSSWDKDDIKDVFLISLSLEPLGNLTALMYIKSELGVFSGEDLLWIISLYDLMVITDFIEHPSMFPHYVKRRIRTAEQGLIMANDEILQMQEKRNEKVEKKAELEKWTGLIWLKYIPLQKVVGDTFEFLGLKVERPPDTEYGPDLRVKYKEKEVILEVEGSKNAIIIDKVRQLHHWLGEESSNVKGVLVGNPFNEIPIKNRPPNKNRSLFTKNLKEFAEARGFSLILSTDLFDPVCKKLKEEKVNAQELMDRMYEGKGMTRLSS